MSNKTAIRIILAIVFWPFTLFVGLGIGVWTFLDIVIAGKDFDNTLLAEIFKE